MSKTDYSVTRKGIGGWRTHKPGCQCNACSAQRRKEETLTIRARDGGTTLETEEKSEVLNADLPVFVTQGNTKRDRVAQWIMLRATEPGITNKEIAARLGIARQSLQAIITQANQEGWLKFEDSLSKLEYQVIPKVVNNIDKFLDEGDKTVTIETAKGTIFKQYQESKGISEGGTTILALKIEPAENEQAKVITGQIIGKPRQLGE